MDRRKFLKILGAAGVVSALPFKFNPLKGFNGLGLNKAWGYQYSPPLQKFLPSQYLPIVPESPNYYQFAARMDDPVTEFATSKGADLYHISAREFTQQLHPSLPKATKLWGYCNTGDEANQTHIGGLIIATKDKPVRIRLTNTLPNQHILPVDTTIPGADYNAGFAVNRVAVHLHGGFMPWTFDGGPFDYFTPGGVNYASGTSFLNGPANGSVGSGFMNDFYSNNGYPGQVMVPGQADYYYPNHQSYRLMWYHDHAVGITRLNAYAGIASGYLVLDDVMVGLMTSGQLPIIDFDPSTGPKNNRFIPLVFQDKTFIPVGGTPDPKQVGEPGDLWYPSIYDGGPPDGFIGTPLDPPQPSCVPEFFGDTMLVNGIVYPVLKVQQRKYRFYGLNACNARFLRLKLVFEDNLVPGEPKGGYGAEGSLTPPVVGPPFVQIANEAGFLAAPVTFTGKTQGSTMLLAPAERAEWLVDFSALPVGTKLLLYNDAAAPFPGGGPDTDFYPGNPATPQSTPGFGPNTRTLMQIEVVARVGAADRYRPLVLPPLVGSNLKATPNNTRTLSLNEGFDEYGRLIQMIGGTTPNPNPNLAFGVPYLDSSFGSPGVERIIEGDVEVWRIANLTGDTHPMHFHLQDLQIISRRTFDPGAFPTITYMGPARPPDPNENGFKETVRMNPNEVVEVIGKWDLPAVPSTFPAIPDSPRTGGKEYVWHCHILEHEEHDMMHALVIDSPV